VLVTAASPPPPAAGLEVVEVATAAGMLDAVRTALPGASALIMAAAVADYRAAETAPRKLKKEAGRLQLSLVPTVDVLRTLRTDPRRQGVVVVGFAAETDDLLDNAKRKLEEKGLDLIVANDVGTPGIGLGSDDNAVTLIGREGILADVGPAPKREVAAAVLAAVRPFLEVGTPR
jgi:phosphopantothenoylcysteine decarboxylase/phosphopantothenate--cysteine ligase